MTPYPLIIPLQRRFLMISLVASIMIPMSNPIAEPSGVLSPRVLRLQNREFALLTDKLLCSRACWLPPLTLPTPSLTPSFLDTPSDRGSCYITPVSSTQLPIHAVLRSGARSIPWSWANFWSTASIEYLDSLGRQPILDQKRTQPVPPTPWQHSVLTQYKQRFLCKVLRQKDR